VSAPPHPSLVNLPCDLIGGRAIPIQGEEVASHNPARPGERIWSGTPRVDHIDQAISAARDAQSAWARTAPADRAAALRAYQGLVKERAEEIAALIRDEVGKPMWEAKQEAGALAAKVDVCLDDSLANSGLSRVTEYEVSLTDTRRGVCRFHPHGVMAVIGPFNFPAHLPNGHIVPALLMGNTVVFKPSDKTPAVGQMLGELLTAALEEAGAPRGVVNVVQGAAEPAARLTTHEDIDGILFTGSWPVGRRILEANLDRPGRIVALEMGGNNPAIVMDDADLPSAVVECARAAFATAGQRCTCTRRIIVHEAIAEKFLEALVRVGRSLKIGDPNADPPVFMGPLIRAESRDAAVQFVEDLDQAGGEVLLRPKSLNDLSNAPGGHFISPGVVRVERFTRSDDVPGRDAGCDVEVFGPVVRVSVVSSLDDAIEQANATRYGLAASIFTSGREHAERFLADVRAGCLNVNTGTAGASSKLPFGGLGLSGNHRPAAAFAHDYCAYPVASMIEESPAAAMSPGMEFNEAWVK